MPIPDKVAAANKINEFLRGVVTHGGLRLEELRMAASVAAERVRKTGAPYEFAPMSSRERRIVHLALRDHPDLRTESQDEGGRRRVVVYPKDYKAASKLASRTIR